MASLTNERVLFDRIKIESAQSRFLVDFLGVVFGVSLLTASSYISFKIPFSIVPITGQTFAVLVLGSMYGGKRALITVASYLTLGGMGLGVFAGGAGGIAQLFGPTGGYLIGFLFAAFAMGYISERYKWDRDLKKSLLLYFIGHKIIFFFGVAWLSRFVGLEKAIQLGFIPFIAGEVVKTTLASLFSKTIWFVKK